MPLKLARRSSDKWPQKILLVKPDARDGPVAATAILLKFLKIMARQTTQRDGQDLPVRQTLPPANDGPNSVKSLEKRGKMPSSI
jgi:hypothetical protein